METTPAPEQWRRIDGFPRYFISDLGRVKNSKTGRILRQYLDRKGYARVKLPDPDKEIHNKMVHRLVAETFIPPVAGAECVDHIDRNPGNNLLSNLRWCSLAENCRNRSIMKNNTSGITGVYLHKTTGKWMSYIRVEGRMRYLGLFETKEEAEWARLYEAGYQYGEFHPTEAAPIPAE